MSKVSPVQPPAKAVAQPAPAAKGTLPTQTGKKIVTGEAPSRASIIAGSAAVVLATAGAVYAAYQAYNTPVAAVAEQSSLLDHAVNAFNITGITAGYFTFANCIAYGIGYAVNNGGRFARAACRSGLNTVRSLKLPALPQQLLLGARFLKGLDQK